MRARGLVAGWVVVIAFAVLLVIAGISGARQQDRIDRSVATPVAADQFIEAWEASRTGTFVAYGTFERRSEVTGSRIASEDVLAQRPPQRLHRQLGGIEGRDDDRLLVCPALPSEEDGRDAAGACELGDAGGATYAASVAGEVAGLHTIVGGADPLYTVRRDDDGCFALDQTRVDPRAPFGHRARFCFDAATGAPSASRVEYDGGIVEVLVVTEIRAEVTDTDLRP
jgi:hypothetical protein